MNKLLLGLLLTVCFFIGLSPAAEEESKISCNDTVCIVPVAEVTKIAVNLKNIQAHMAKQEIMLKFYQDQCLAHTQQTKGI